MVQTRSHSYGHTPSKSTPSKSRGRRKKDDNTSSDEETQTATRSEPPSITLVSINEEDEALCPKGLPTVRVSNIYPNLDLKGLQITKKPDSPKKVEKSLAPILEESDDLVENNGDIIEDIPMHTAPPTVPEKQRKRKFYFPPAKTLVPTTHVISTAIDTGMEIDETYIDVKGTKLGKEKIASLYSLPTVNSKDSELKDSIITPDFEAKHSAPVPKSYNQLRKERKAQKDSDAGKEWFNFKPPEMTEEIKRDLEILKMRSILDPKRFYKHNDRKTLPKYFQVGKIVDDSTDFYSSRVPNKQRKQNLTEELLADAEFKKYQKRKYNEIQMRNKARGAKRRRIRHGKFSKHRKETAS